MSRRTIFFGCVAMAGAMGACTTIASKPVVAKRPAQVAPAKPRTIERVTPARYVLLDAVGVSYDETGEPSPIRSPEPALVSGKRLVVDGGLITNSAEFADALIGFRSLPARLGGGYVFWSEEHSYHASTFLGKLEPFANIGARGGIRPWFDSFVMRTEIGPLEVTPSSYTVRRTELSRFSEMISLDGKLGVRTDSVGRMEASVDGGKTFRPLTVDDGKRYVGPSPGPSNTLVFRRDSSSDWSGGRPDRMNPETRVLSPAGTLIPFDPKANDPQVFEPPAYSAPAEEPALTRKFAPAELELAVVAGALVPGDQVVVLHESMLRVLSAKTGELIQDLPLALGSPEFGHCQPMTLGADVFLACTHASGAHLYALRGTPTAVQLEATFPEPGAFVAGLGKRFLFLGRCGSTPPTVRDFPGYGSSDETPNAAEPDPSAGVAPAPEPPQPPEDLPEKPKNEAAVCIRLDDGTWVERRIDGLEDRTKTYFLPGDNGQVTVVVFDKPNADKPNADKPALKATEGVRFIHVDVQSTGFRPESFFQPYEPNEPHLRTISRDVWLDEKDGSVHGWERQLPKEEEEPSEPKEPSDPEDVAETVSRLELELGSRGRMVGVQIKSDGSIAKLPLPEGVETVIVGGPYAAAQAKTDAGSKYYESTDGGRSFLPVTGPVPGNFLDYAAGDIEGCSIIGCTLGGGLVRLGWGGPVPPSTPPDASGDKPVDIDALTSKVFDPHTLVPAPMLQRLVCHLDGKEADKKIDSDKPFAATLATNDQTNIGMAVDHKWTAMATTPFELKPTHTVLFENVDVAVLEGEMIPLLRSTATNPVGLFLRTKEHLFDLSPGAKRKPVALSAEARGYSAAELDRDTFVLLEPRSGEIQLVRGPTARTIVRITQIPDVSRTSFTLARRAGAGDDVLALAVVQSGTGDILLGDLDLARATVGPLRVAGNMRKLDMGTACVKGPRDYRVILNMGTFVQFDPAEEGRGGALGSSFITLGAGNACLEATEIRLTNESTLVVRYSGTDTGGHPAVLHDHGTLLRVTCKRD